VAGINFGGLSLKSEIGQGRVIGFDATRMPNYTEGQVRLDGLVSSGRKALDALAAWMPGFHAIWFAAYDDVIKNP
jgi:hypothetical protein